MLGRRACGQFSEVSVPVYLLYEEEEEDTFSKVSGPVYLLYEEEEEDTFSKVGGPVFCFPLQFKAIEEQTFQS